MCGIAGWFTPQLVQQHCLTELSWMTEAIRHRGPDDKGALLLEHAALGHTRLAIIDLDQGKQPLTYQDRFYIVFNGEIYNYRALREGLTKQGVNFKTHSDTEVIVALYAQYGEKAFSMLRGMFAIAIWDSVKQCGLLVRDEIGIKPLFYSLQSNGNLVFGSEAKAILAKDQDARGNLNVDALHLVMNFRYLPGDLSLFRGIQQLKPGTILHWHVDGSVKKSSFHYHDYNTSANVLDDFEESVRLHLTSDVEVGAYLSGGIDSACIAALAAKFSPEQLRTFTLNIGDDPNEAANAAKTARLLGLRNIQGEIKNSIKNQIPNLVWSLEIPKVNSLQVSHLSQLTSTHVKVVLSGLGADEIFLGYNAHRIMGYADQLSRFTPGFMAQLISIVGVKGIQSFGNSLWTEKQRALLMFGALGNWPRVYGLLRNVWDSPAMRKVVYGPRMLDANLTDAFSIVSNDWSDNVDPVMAMAEYEWRNKMVNDLLWQEDRCSMAYGLEVRVPFLDQLFAARVKTLTRDQLMPNGAAKGYMRDMLQDILPVEVMSRPKSGFQVDAASFFKAQLSDLADYWLCPDMVREKGLFNPKFVATVRTYPPSKKVRWHYFMLYLMLMSHIWVDLFEQGKSPVELADVA